MLLCFNTSDLAAQDEETDFLLGFLEGSYTVVGTYPESNQVFRGNSHLEKMGSNLKLTRIIDADTTIGKAWLERISADEITVLKSAFKKDDRFYEAIYLIDSDLNNYARLTGHVYFKKGKTRRAGLEAWFIKLAR
jgi:hypothetical protein